MFDYSATITMAGGGILLPIGRIGVGQMVMSPDGNATQVRDVVFETADGLVSIGIHDNRPLRVTRNQSIMTDRGTIPASMIVPGDRLQGPMDVNGHTEFMDVYAVTNLPFRGTVLSPVVGGDGTFLANGVCVQHGYGSSGIR